MRRTKEKQTCSKCQIAKPLEAFRRQSQRANGRDTICRACRSRRDHDAKANSFGPLPVPEGSEEWVHEVWRRAARIRTEKEP